MISFKYIHSDKNTFLLEERNKIPYLTAPKLNALPGIKHLFSTRLGGVSTGNHASLNFSYKMDSSKENVYENFKRVANLFGCSIDCIVGADQTHTATVKVVDINNAGNGITKEKEFFDVDGLVTNDPSVILFVTCADCVPILLADPKKKVVSAVHSGWRGTCSGIARNAVETMKNEFGSKVSDIVVAIGPSICKNCYEVSEDLYDAFSDSSAYKNIDVDLFFEKGRSESKYQLDLHRANELLLLESGILRENIDITNTCTACNSEILFSHRASNGKRGGMGAFIKIQEE